MDKNLTSKNTFLYFKDKFNNENIHDVRDLNVKFLKNRKNIKIDYDRLREIEQKYTYFNGLNKQILSSQATSTPYHDRFFYPKTTYQENLYWLMLNYEKTESVLGSVKPDYIFDIDTGEIQRTLINEVANYKGMAYINLEYARYESFAVPTFNLGLKLEKYFIDAYNKNKEDNNLEKFIKEVKNYRAKSSIMPNMYKNYIESSYNFKLRDAIKYILLNTYKFVKSQIYYFKNNKNHFKINIPLDSDPIKKLLWKYISVFRKWYLYSNFNKYFLPPIDEKYVYLPLHLIPESTTFVKSPMYINEISIIEAISKTLPISWKLYVKEHPMMIGERNLEFYKKVNRLHNVKLVKPNYYDNPKLWIERSLAVVSIVGSSAFEATMLNKPTIVFGNVCYNVLSNVKVTNSFEELEQLFRSIENNDWYKDNTTECAAYLKTINDVGVNLNMWSLLNLSSQKINGGILEANKEDEFIDLNNRLLNFYEKAVEIYDDKNRE